MHLHASEVRAQKTSQDPKGSSSSAIAGSEAGARALRPRRGGHFKHATWFTKRVPPRFAILPLGPA